MFPNYNGGYGANEGFGPSTFGPRRGFGVPNMGFRNPPRQPFNGPLGFDYTESELDSMRPRLLAASGSTFENGSAYRVNCGELRLKHVGKFVEITGKIHKVQMGRFVQIRDQYGTTQLVVPQERSDMQKRFTNMPINSYIAVRGLVRRRPTRASNERLSTGDIEILIDDILMVKVNKSIDKPMSSIPPLLSEFKRSFSTTTISSEEYHKFHKLGLVRKLNERKINIYDAMHRKDEKLNLYGWVEKHSEGSRFFTLRDGYGKIQCIVPKEDPNLSLPGESMLNEVLLCVTGTVKDRPAAQINPSSVSGRVEFVLEEITVLPPGNPEDDILNIDEDAGSSKSAVNSHTIRTHTCGEIRPNHVGQRVTIAGWLQYRRLDKFMLLRDAYGLTQCVMPEAKADSPKLSDIPLESVVQATGVVAARPPNTINSSMLTGEVELYIDTFEVLNKSEFTPFNLKNYSKPKEALRMQHRYIDLRFPEMQNNLRLRSTMLHSMRCFLIDKKEFVEVETPTLFCRTPGGAREFVVPTHHPGLFYSLVQSPQQFKQMLMAGGIDRYFQIARCYRDEATRPDRQPEFTQLDIEMSFTTLDGVLTLIEQLMHETYPGSLKPPPYQRMTYREAMDTYGSDRPNITYDLKLKNVTSVFKTPTDNDQFGAFCIVCENNGKLSSKMRETVKQLKNKYNIRTIDNLPGIEKRFTAEAQKNFTEMTKIKEESSFIVGYGINDDVCNCLGEIRVLLAEDMISKNLLTIVEENVGRPIWIVDFPLMLRAPGGGLQTCHHPFTAPHPDDITLLDNEPLRVRSLAYDLVINGAEVGGGSVRAHDPTLQTRLLDMLNIPAEPLKHLIDALRSGCPPHAGIALGIDRLVSIACKSESIRDVIAFPKSHDQRDPLSLAPQPLQQEDLEYYHLTPASIPLPENNDEPGEPPIKKIKADNSV